MMRSDDPLVQDIQGKRALAICIVDQLLAPLEQNQMPSQEEVSKLMRGRPSLVQKGIIAMLSHRLWERNPDAWLIQALKNEHMMGVALVAAHVMGLPQMGPFQIKPLEVEPPRPGEV